ncbi:hypothetical protein MKW92_041215 [Papaver armeniacum]|nr:hypothetical protein MKW92_041215 [Papaver armeniacum]
MGAPKQKWTAAAEEEALVAGINKHGTGKWKNIQNDPEFSHVLAARSNIDMKDKLMEECVSATGEGSRPKSVEAAASTPKVPKMTASSIFQSPLHHLKLLLRMYDAMILEALSNITDPNGAEIGSINDFIEQWHEVPSNIRRFIKFKVEKACGAGQTCNGETPFL